MLSSLRERTDVPIVQPLAVMTRSAPILSPGRVVVTMGDSFSEPGYMGSDMEQSECGQTQIVCSFPRAPGRSPPPVSLLGMFPDSRRGQGGGMVVVVVAESLRQKLGPVYPWGKLLTS